MSWHDPGPGQNVTYSYTYNGAGQATSASAISGTDTITHYPQGWLQSDCGPQVIAQSPDHCYHWTYDSAGNITTATADAGSPITYTYTYDPRNNELMTLYAPAYANTTTYYSYDSSGNTTAITSPVNGSLTAPGAINTHLGYDAAGRVDAITLKDGRSISITYNADGERASYRAITGTNQLLYSAQFSYSGGVLTQASVVSATAGGGTTSYTDSYLYGGDGRPVEFTRQQNGTTSYYWYEYDGRGNVVAVTDINGNVVDSYEYDLWGEELTDTSHEAVPQRLRFGGMWFDEEVQWLWDDGSNRYYDPELERYYQPDSPTGGSYVYAGDDPSVARITSHTHAGLMPRTSGFPSGIPWDSVWHWVGQSAQAFLRPVEGLGSTYGVHFNLGIQTKNGGTFLRNWHVRMVSKTFLGPDYADVKWKAVDPPDPLRALQGDFEGAVEEKTVYSQKMFGQVANAAKGTVRFSTFEVKQFAQSIANVSKMTASDTEAFVSQITESPVSQSLGSDAEETGGALGQLLETLSEFPPP